MSLRCDGLTAGCYPAARRMSVTVGKAFYPLSLRIKRPGVSGLRPSGFARLFRRGSGVSGASPACQRTGVAGRGAGDGAGLGRALLVACLCRFRTLSSWADRIAPGAAAACVLFLWRSFVLSGGMALASTPREGRSFAKGAGLPRFGGVRPGSAPAPGFGRGPGRRDRAACRPESAGRGGAWSG